MRPVTRVFAKVWFAFCLAAPSLPALAAGGAFAVDDADIGKAGSCQNEAWVSLASSRDFVGVESPACVFDFGQPVEITALYQRAKNDFDWATTMGLQAKAVPINNDRIAVSWAFGTARDVTLQRQLVFANFPVTFKFGETFRIHTNAGWLYDGRVDIHYATGGVGFDWDFARKFSLMGEVYIQEGRQTAFPTVTQPRLQLGLRHIPVGTVDIDFILGRNLNGRGGNWMTIGLTVRSE